MCVINRHVVHLSLSLSLSLPLSHPLRALPSPSSSSSRSRSTNAPYMALYCTLMCMYLPARASVYLCHRRAVSPGSSPLARTIQFEGTIPRTFARARQAQLSPLRPPPDTSDSVDELASEADSLAFSADESVRCRGTHAKVLSSPPSPGAETPSSSSDPRLDDGRRVAHRFCLPSGR